MSIDDLAPITDLCGGADEGRTMPDYQLKCKVVALAASMALGAAMSAPAAAQTAAPAPWVLAPDMAYGYGADNQMTTYKLGTNNAKFLFKGAKKVPRNTLFFVGENGQLYMRTGPYLEGGGKFSFGPG